MQLDKFNKENINYVKTLLKNYKKNVSMVRMLENEINMILNNYDGVRGISYDNVSSKTNKISSSVENEIIEKEQTIERLTRELNRYKLENEKIDIALNSLDNEDQLIIKLKFIEGYRNTQIGSKLYLTDVWVSKKIKRILIKLIDLMCLS